MGITQAKAPVTPASNPCPVEGLLQGRSFTTAMSSEPLILVTCSTLLSEGSQGDTRNCPSSAHPVGSLMWHEANGWHVLICILCPLCQVQGHEVFSCLLLSIL